MRGAVAVLAGLVLVVGGCSDDGEDAKTSTPATAPASSAGVAPEASAAVPVQTKTVDASGDMLTMSVGPLVRSGDAVVLTVQTRLDRAGGNGGAAVVSRHFSTILSTSFDSARLIDETGRRVYLTAKQSDGKGCVCTSLLRVEPGETRPLQAAFTGVPAGVERMSVMLPHAGVFTDVPVVAGVVPTPPPGRNATGREQKALDLSTAGTSVAAGLDAYTERLDVGLRTKKSADNVDISLDTDVLFRIDSAKLTPAATKTVAAAVTELKAAGAGPLTITGHTDSTGSTAHNQALSQQRAQAVTNALRGPLPDATWPKTVAAKGESQPAVPNDSAGNRALNRRVTITFPARKQAGTSPSASPAVALPKTKGQQGKSPDGVEVTFPLNRGTVRFVPVDATVRGSFVLVNLMARNTGDGKATINDFLGQGVFTVRDEFDPFARYGAAGIRLLQGDTASWGLDYETAAGDHRCLCDRMLNQSIPPKGERLLSLWFPAPPPGTQTIALDVPDKLRITDIPIT